MSRIDELTAKNCPDGEGHKKLEDMRYRLRSGVYHGCGC